MRLPASGVDSSGQEPMRPSGKRRRKSAASWNACGFGGGLKGGQLLIESGKAYCVTDTSDGVACVPSLSPYISADSAAMVGLSHQFLSLQRTPASLPALLRLRRV